MFLRTLLGLFLLFASTALARWQSFDEAPFRVNFIHDEYTINANGHYKSITEFEVEILNESARADLSLFRYNYKKATGDLKLLNAQTRNEDETYDVPENLVENKPTASQQTGFDENYQLTIAFPQVEVGSKLYVKMQYTTKELPIKNFFSLTYAFGLREHVQKQDLHLTSDVPLFLDIYNPGNVLKIDQYEKKKKYHLDVDLLKPVGFVPTDEREPNIPQDMVPHIDIATAKDWNKDILKDILTDHEKVLNEKWPEILSDAFDEALHKSSLLERAEILTSAIETQFRYLGDWRTVKGSFVPRSLGTIAGSGFGDCKDFSALLAAGLRKLGYKAYVAWIYRDSSYIPFDSRVPLLSATNHAIVFVEHDGKSHWFDPTNRVSYVKGPFSDIAGRQALVLDPAGPRLLETPEIKSEDNKIKIDLTYDASDLEVNDIQAELSLSGLAAADLSGLSLRESKLSIERRILDWLTNDREHIFEYKVNDFDLSNRIVRDVSFKVRYKEWSSLASTSAGHGLFLFESYSINQLIDQTPNRQTDLYLNSPRELVHTVHIKNIKRVGISKLDCDIDTPWIKAKRKIAPEATGVTVTDLIQIRKPYILTKEYQQPHFEALRNQFLRCYQKAILVFDRVKHKK